MLRRSCSSFVPENSFYSWFKKSSRPWIATDRSMSNIRWNNVIIFSKNEGMMQQCQSRLGGMTTVSSHSSGGAALVWDSDAPRRRRFAAEAWDDTAVIPPFGTKRAGARLRLPLCNQMNLTSRVAGFLLNTPLF